MFYREKIMVRTSYSVLLAFVLLTLACEFSKAEDKPVEYDRTAVLATLDEAASTTEDPEVKRALKKMSECVERGNKLLVLSGLRALPPEIGQLINLTGLTLHDNQLTALPPEIGKLTNLTWLYLEGNQLTTLPPEIKKLTKLTELQIERNPLTDEGLEHLKSLKSLKRLNLCETNLLGSSSFLR